MSLWNSVGNERSFIKVELFTYRYLQVEKEWPVCAQALFDFSFLQ